MYSSRQGNGACPVAHHRDPHDAPRPGIEIHHRVDTDGLERHRPSIAAGRRALELFEGDDAAIRSLGGGRLNVDCGLALRNIKGGGWMG
jgi:hypothetical protein